MQFERINDSFIFNIKSITTHNFLLKLVHIFLTQDYFFHNWHNAANKTLVLKTADNTFVHRLFWEKRALCSFILRRKNVLFVFLWHISTCPALNSRWFLNFRFKWEITIYSKVVNIIVKKWQEIKMFDVTGSPLYKLHCITGETECVYGIASFYRNIQDEDQTAVCNGGSYFASVVYLQEWITTTLIRNINNEN